MLKHHCRHCGQKHVRIYRAFKNVTYDKVLPLVRAYVLEQGEGSHVCVELAAIDTSSRFGLVRKAFMQLNREGILSQAHNSAPHDSTRDKWGPGTDSAWMASSYTVLKSEGWTFEEEKPNYFEHRRRDEKIRTRYTKKNGKDTGEHPYNGC